MAAILRRAPPRNNKEYASGLCLDANGCCTLVDVARLRARAILWRGAILPTLPTMDDRLGRLDPAGYIRRDQSHRSGTSSGLGTGDHSRRPLRGWRLVPLRVADARRLCCFEEMARRPSASPAARVDSSALRDTVLYRVGHVRTDPAARADAGVRARSPGARSVLAAIWRGVVELDFHYAA